MMEVIRTKLLLPDHIEVEASLRIGEANVHGLVLVVPGDRNVEATGVDLFDSLRNLRATLEEDGIRILCAGARADVYPSGMSRTMSDGRKAYTLKLGLVAQRNDLVDIFSYASPREVGTVAEQRRFHEQWISSIKR